MKRLLIALLLCLFFSTGAEAKRVMITASPIGGLDETGATDPESGIPICDYSHEGYISAFVHVRAGMTVSLMVIVGDQTMSLNSWIFSRETTFNASYVNPRFTVVGVNDWILAWTVESGKGKERIIDSIELASGTCQ